MVKLSKVFLSYSRRDRPEVVELIYSGLVAAGHDVFRDVESIPVGEVFQEHLLKAINEADVVLCLFSEQSAQSHIVLAEASFAVRQNKMIPIKIGQADLPVIFRALVYLDLSDWRGDYSDDRWAQLLRTIDRRAAAKEPDKKPSDLEGAPAGARTPIEEPLLGEEIRPLPGERYPKVPSRLVFVAHASADKERIRPLVEVLVDVGFKVWIDKPYECKFSPDYLRRLAKNRIEYGADWKESIRKAIKKADRLLAFWSMDAVKGQREQFHYEVYQGLVQNKLWQCKIDELVYSDIAFPYAFHHIADLSSVEGKAFHPAFKDLIIDTAKGRGRRL